MLALKRWSQINNLILYLKKKTKFSRRNNKDERIVNEIENRKSGKKSITNKTNWVFVSFTQIHMLMP